MKPPKAVLFDLDATLVDRRASLARAGETIYRRFSERLRATNAQSIIEILWRIEASRMPIQAALHAIFAEAPWQPAPSFEEFQEHYDAEYPGCAVPMAGMHETLDALRSRGIRLGLITNGGVKVQGGKIRALGLPNYLDSVCISAARGYKKPDREIFEMALAELGTSPEDAWFVGDNPECDVMGAQDAGMTPIWMRGYYTWPEGVPEPALKIDSLREIVELLSGCDNCEER